MSDRWRTIPGFIEIGSTGKVRGRDGEIKLYIEDVYLEDAVRAEFLFIENNGNKVPLAVESFREVNDILVKLNGVDDPGEASKWASAPVYLPSDEITRKDAPDPGSDLDYSDVTGFIITDKTLGTIGAITEIREFPQQEMAIVQYQGAEVMVPLNPVFIERIDRKGQIVYTDLPDGLLDVSKT